MATPARQLEDRLDRIERMLEELLRAPGRAAGGLLSKREAARRLRIDRTPGATLDQLLRSGRLRSVPALNGRGVRIPVDEVERLLREGLTPAVAPAPPARRPPGRARRGAGASETAEAIRSIPIPKFDEE